VSGALDSVLQWAAGAIGSGAKVVGTESLRPAGSPWLLRFEHHGEIVEAVLKAGRDRDELATEAAALSLAEAHALPTPRLIAADLTGEAAGAMAILFTVLPGSADIPGRAEPRRLRALGAAAAALHAIPLTPVGDLPLRERHMPWIDFAAMRRAGATMPGAEEELSTPLLDAADELLQSVPVPSEATVFVHGDLWTGNTMWDGDAYAGMIDWEAAGAGNCGVDLGSLRLDTALLYGVEFVDDVLIGWQETRGLVAPDVDYWDVVAALNTRADMAGFLPTMHAAGRTDLDGPTLTMRRDAFLRCALDGLGE